MVDYFIQNLIRFRYNFEETFPNKKIFTIVQDNRIKKMNLKNFQKMIYGS